MPSEDNPQPPEPLLEQVRKRARNRPVLLIADHPGSPAWDWIAATCSSADALAELRPDSRRACALLLTPWIAPERLDSVIAHLRDFLLLELYVLHPGDAAEQSRRIGALGLRCLKMHREAETSWGLNHFSLKTYKKIPGWLNSRHWANPQNWNRFRW